MSSRHDLHLHEQLLLLVLRDREGTVDYRAGFYNLAMGGAVLAELALAGVVRVEESGKALVEAMPGTARPRDEIMAEALERIRASKRRRRASSWVSIFGNIKRLRHRTALGLCRRGVLRTRESRILLVFSRKLYPAIDPGPERELIADLREAVMGDGDVEAGLGAVIALAHVTGSLRIHFERKELKARKARLKAIGAGERFASGAGHAAPAARDAAKAAVAAARAAVAAARTAVIVTTSPP